MRDTRIKLSRKSPLQVALNQRVNAWLAEQGKNGTGGQSLAVKAAVLIVWWALSYALVLASGDSWLGVIFGALSLGLASAGIGFNIMHDANHGAFSKGSRANRLLGYTVDFLGASSYVWRYKHNVLHHTYPNLVGTDDDIDIGPLARLAPNQPHLGIHRWQHLYMWPLYAWICVKWHWLDDFKQVAQGRIGEHAFPRPKGGALWAFVGLRALFFVWALVLPPIILGWAKALTFYFISMWTLGLMLAVVFQLAHCVEEAHFLDTTHLSSDTPLTVDFAQLQLDTTVDFARGNRLITWYLGGLNYQAVHHLFPRISHVHYPQISLIVEQVCAEHEQIYRCAGSFPQALGSHYRWLKRMGAAEQLSPVAAQPAVA